MNYNSTYDTVAVLHSDWYVLKTRIKPKREAGQYNLQKTICILSPMIQFYVQRNLTRAENKLCNSVLNTSGDNQLTATKLFRKTTQNQNCRIDKGIKNLSNIWLPHCYLYVCDCPGGIPHSVRAASPSK